MLFVSDEFAIRWRRNPSGPQDNLTPRLIAAAHDPDRESVELSELDFALVEAIFRLRHGDREQVAETAVARAAESSQGDRSAPPIQARDRLDRLISTGIVGETETVPVKDAYYMPMLYYQMFIDNLKMDAYLRALERQVQPGMRVLDVGAGVGIFSVAAAKLGAEVVAIEPRPMIETAKGLAADNGVADRIEFYRTDLYDQALAQRLGGFDLIVSEFIGDEIFDEDILLKTHWMRKLFDPESRAILLPRRLDAFAVPFECDLAVNRYANRSSRVQAIGAKHGIEVDAVERLVAREGLRNDFSDRMYVSSFREIDIEDLRFLAPPERFYSADLDAADGISDVIFKSSAAFAAERSGRLDGVLLYFTAWLDDEVRISSAPWLAKTHWPQVVYLRRGERTVAAGDAVDLAIAYVGDRGFEIDLR